MIWLSRGRSLQLELGAALSCFPQPGSRFGSWRTRVLPPEGRLRGSLVVLQLDGDGEATFLGRCRRPSAGEHGAL